MLHKVYTLLNINFQECLANNEYLQQFGSIFVVTLLFHTSDVTGKKSRSGQTIKVNYHRDSISTTK